MAFTYDADLLSTSELYQVRLEIGDTDPNEYFLENGEIRWVMSQEASFYATCSKCCSLIVARLSKEVDHTTGIVSERLSQLVKHYSELRDYFSKSGSASYPWMRSITKSDKELNEEDSDRVKPFFKRGLHDNDQ